MRANLDDGKPALDALDPRPGRIVQLQATKKVAYILPFFPCVGGARKRDEKNYSNACT